jgi:ABC-type sugar transport system substrate-binding protein
MTTKIRGLHRPRNIRQLTTLAAVLVTTAVLAACSSSSSGGSTTTSTTTSRSSGSASGPQASAAALDTTIKKLMMSDTIKYDTLNPVLQRSINKAATPLTDAQWKKLQECLRGSSCTTGHGKLTVAYANDNINPWRQTWRAEFTAAAIQSPEVSKIIYNLGTDVPSWIANVNSLVAQRVDILMINSIFGGAILPAVQAAKNAGITVISAGTPLPAQVRSLVSGEADDDLCTPWKDTANTLIKQFPNGGTYALYTGVPGNASAAAWQPCLTAPLKAAGWKEIANGFTQWTPQGQVQQANALYASGKTPTFLAYDYTLEDFAKPWLSAGKTPPIMASDALNQAYLTVAKAAKDKGVNMQAYISCARDWYARIGLEYGLYLKEGKTQAPFVIPSGAAPLSTLLASYDPSMPANAPIPHSFTASQEHWILQAQS